jgi:hypothetical protein
MPLCPMVLRLIPFCLCPGPVNATLIVKGHFMPLSYPAGEDARLLFRFYSSIRNLDRLGVWQEADPEEGEDPPSVADLVVGMDKLEAALRQDIKGLQQVCRKRKWETQEEWQAQVSKYLIDARNAYTTMMSTRTPRDPGWFRHMDGLVQIYLRPGAAIIPVLRS